MAVDINRALRKRLPMPPCEGPQLKPFRHFRKIEFLKLLSCDPLSEECATGSGYVFDVRIDKERFALKMFRFYDAADARYDFSWPSPRKISDETLAFHSDPFFAECRAYGRINQYYEDLANKTLRSKYRQRYGKIRLPAVPCYGYTTLPAEFESSLRKRFRVSEWDRPEREVSKQAKRQPFRCLVKKLIDSRVSILNPRRMLADLKQLRKLGIYTRDIHARNYKDGLLVDFSIAWTKPHWCMEAMGPYQRGGVLQRELVMFDNMIEYEEVKTTVRASRNTYYCFKLRTYGPPDDDDEEEEEDDDDDDDENDKGSEQSCHYSQDM
ncbi:kinetochore Sim4 complex subunit FTA2-domain-containing protein [Xylaria sp. FL0933]|nr:kinetochore Sim4 complex subunit FTA2-domain-containing protein [Xylaria sp. FL0933]